MKFKAEMNQNAGGWIVKIGRARKNGDIRYTGNVYSDKVEAEQQAAWRNADDLMRRMKTYLPDVSIEQAKEIGFQMNTHIDQICDRLEKEDPQHDRMDSRGWLA